MTFLRFVIALQLCACLIGWSHQNHKTHLCEDGTRYVCVEFWFPSPFWVQSCHGLAFGYQRQDGGWRRIKLTERSP